MDSSTFNKQSTNQNNVWKSTYLTEKMNQRGMQEVKTKNKYIPKSKGVWRSSYITEKMNENVLKKKTETRINQNVEQNMSKMSNTDYNSYSDKVLQMMAKMGFDEKKGLGRFDQGIHEPVAASTQKGRSGFGLKLNDLDEATFDPTEEHVQIRETVEWLNNNTNDFNKISSAKLRAWMVVGPKKMAIDDETSFCPPSILRDVLAAKTVFDMMNLQEMRRARTKSNPFETIRGSIFQNRAAVKMANMDACLDFMFTDPKERTDAALVKSGELFQFADVCAGPGGFTEYVLWRKKWQAKGFGFTLRNEMDFKLDKFLAGHAQTFEQYYGAKGDGDIYDPENIHSLKQHVLNRTNGAGVHLMMADGGFSVEGQENLQEILSKQLYLCQCLVALSIVRVKGNFVIKLFDIFTPFSVGLIYLMRQCFEQVCILKPNTSRPANSERFLICKSKKADTQIVERYLVEVNQQICDNKNSSRDVTFIVPLDVIQGDKVFFEYICRSNDAIGRNQILGLKKILAFYKDRSLTEEIRQEQIRLDCLRAWKLPLSKQRYKY